MSAPEGGKGFERVLALAERLRPVIAKYGPPHEVLPACLFIAAAESKGAGRTYDEVLSAWRGWLATVFDEEESWRKPAGDRPIKSIDDMTDVAREASRQVFEIILPAIRGQAGGPLVAALTMALVDVARAQEWPLDDLTAFVKDVYERHAGLDAFVKRTGDA